MNVRIIAGMFGSRILDAPGRRSTHAMSERIRSAMFNSILSELPDAEVLDAFAGSGSLGIEALSRGARSATFVEKDRVAAKIIRKNLERLPHEGIVIGTSVHNWLTSSPENVQYDIIFADPPYHDPQLGSVYGLFDRLKSGGLMIVSHPDDVLFESTKRYRVESVRKYGNANLSYLRKSTRRK